MLSHPVFTDILMHSDEELSEILGARIISRDTIHQWPLSCVQKIVLENGKQLVYKSQLPPTVECDFYENAVTGLLPAHRVIGKLGKSDTMLIEWIDAPLLSENAQAANELSEHGKKITAQISSIGGNLPVYLDIGSHDAWMNVANETFEKLRALIKDGRFILDEKTPEELRIWSSSDRIIAILTADPHVIHGDLKADQVFLTGDGYRIIDWQRPYIAPPEVDLVSLLIDRHIEPRGIVSKEVIEIFWFLHLHWAVEAQYTIFPDRRWPLFNQWASEAINNILAE